MIEVIHIRDDDNGPDGVYIGRGSALGNSLKITSSTPRDFVIKRYAKWLRDTAESKTPGVAREVLRALDEIRTKERQYGTVKLVCHCKPLACHGDEIKRYLEELAKCI